MPVAGTLGIKVLMANFFANAKTPRQKANGQTLPSGRRTDANGKPVSNIVLLSTPDDEYNHIRPYLDPVGLPFRQHLHEPGERMDFGYFMNGGITSLIIVTSDGRSVEVGIVGKEGFVGAALAVGVQRSPYRAVVQMAADGLRIRATAVAEIQDSTPHLNLLLNRYAQIQGLQVAQVAACNRLHEIEQRLARWLLMSQDRVDAGALPMTHEFLAQMLGSGRPSVSLAAGILQKAGMIEYTRGSVKIVNRKSLEEAACECYGVIQNFNGELGLK
jgi:CRP-like cAMP-binding protein